MNTKALPVLVRRELWEHRALWITPIVVAALYLLLCLMPGTSAFNFGDSRATLDTRMMPMLYVQLMFIGVLFGLMSIVIFFYLSDCLYAERKDRSILFWKSLPVSDAATVLTKAAVAMLIVPLGAFLLAVVVNLVAFLILYVRLHDSSFFGQFFNWNTGEWLRFNAVLLADILIVALWYSPVVAYQLLTSAWAKGSVMIWTIMPPLFLVLVERLVFGTWHIGRIIGERLGIGMFGMASGSTPHHVTGQMTMGTIFEQIDVIGLLAAPSLWIGVAVAVALLFATIRIRRYRDDT